MNVFCTFKNLFLKIPELFCQGYMLQQSSWWMSSLSQQVKLNSLQYFLTFFMYISVRMSINLEIIGFWRLFSRDLLECADGVGFLMESHLMDSQFFSNFSKNVYFWGFVKCPCWENILRVSS
jgi:hypothetical protein